MEPGTGTFSEEQFREACAELQRPALSGAAWELLMETQGISVYGLLDQPTGLYEYKLIGTLRAPPDILADICMDLDYIRRRIPQVTEAYETECDGETVTYMKMEFPFLLSSRDCVYVKQRRELDFRGRKTQVVLAKGTSLPQFPERPGFIRVSQCQVKLAVESAGHNRSKVFIYCFVNPGGWIPSWLINLLVKSAIPGFLADLEDACLKYQRRT
ncbi:phosphatidylcholine transfer protein-like isoform X1 [Bos javanicus]|uniref:phosphatidylcholine transfer protein-like isoform X1 n=1 Tax=Bos javanicus TaxID=9906 RepID=UPI002AA8B15A|nr:phosphatidylcholine transfer protein-like isoform X1 [Bos javanicus]